MCVSIDFGPQFIFRMIFIQKTNKKMNNFDVISKY